MTPKTHASSSPITCPTTVNIRRNPPRRARPTPSTTVVAADAAETLTSHSHSLSSNPLTISSFPLNDILSIDVATTAASETTINAAVGRNSDDSNSLKVFLRVRPTTIVWKKVISKKVKEASVKSCVVVNDLNSVTVTPPVSDSSRLKSEVYAGFSHVFSQHCSQDDVYDKMMRPIVDDFLNGRSGLLAALGPSGSGKTHTVFGSAKDPGLIPRALRHIFEAETESKSPSSRSFYLSVFEISMEKGKGEKLFDLSPDGSDIHMQQSVVKGLKEVVINNVAQAEAVLAGAKLKRATAMTNSNSQSSRSQCIINIRCAIDEAEGKSESSVSGTGLTFVDLAGAEREKKTGNQGGRLLESNFINNTSMVFGLCLRSLLEHQKNPKKPLQKHFQSSLLTRYLRDYLEGRKRMALILTARSGPDDYFDTSFLLRQASPYMEIKFNNVEDTSKLVGNKRRNQTTAIDKQKRVKLCNADEKDEEGRATRVSSDFKREDVFNEVKGDSKPQISEAAPAEVNNAYAKLQRDHCVMQGLAKAMWKVLKQYKERVKAMQIEIDHLTQKLSSGHDKNLEMEKELNNLKSHEVDCIQMVDEPFVASFSEDNNIETRLPPHEEPEQKFEFSAHQTPQKGSEESPEAGPTVVHFQDSPTNKTSCDNENCVQQNFQEQCSPMKCEISNGRVCLDDCQEKDPTEKTDKIVTDAAAHFPKSHVTDLKVPRDNNSSSTRDKEKENVTNSPQSTFNHKLQSKETSQNPLKSERPRRRLMPASSLLLRDVGCLDVTDDNVKHKVGRGGQRLAEDECQRSRGNATLLRLLKNHLPR
ncbi:hypothetical protein vseg_017853 [Gypsophila vaccaria]